MIILPFETISCYFKSRSGQILKIVTLAPKGYLSYAECHGESNGTLSFAIGSIDRRQFEYENLTSSIFEVFDVILVSNIKRFS